MICWHKVAFCERYAIKLRGDVENSRGLRRLDADQEGTGIRTKFVDL